jgi:transposase
MLGFKERGQPELFVTGSLRQLLPDDHVLVRVDRVLNLSWLRNEVAELYCADNGRPGIDPEVAVRLMLAGLLLGIVHDRRLMREAQVNLAIRWFAGYALHEVLPDHSSLTRVRQRWGPDRFKAILARTVEACIAAKIATGEVVHLDATLIRADVSWGAVVDAHVDAVVAGADETRPLDPPAGGPPAPGGTARRFCRTDPDASLGKGGRTSRVEPAYKQHTAVDALCGVVLDVEVTGGAVHDTNAMAGLDAVPRATGRPMAVATLDAGYAIARVFADLEARGIEAIVPTRDEAPPRAGVIPSRRFKLDALHDRLRCPRGRHLVPHSQPNAAGLKVYRSSAHDCRPCPLREACFSPAAKRRSVLLSKDHPALMRARRKRLAWGERERRLYSSHRGRVEGVHGEAKAWHGLARAVRRGLSKRQDPGLLDCGGDQPKAAGRLAPARVVAAGGRTTAFAASACHRVTAPRVLQQPQAYDSHLSKCEALTGQLGGYLSSGAHSTEEAAAVATRASPQDGECQRYVAQITHPDIFVHGGLTVRKPDEHVGAAA